MTEDYEETGKTETTEIHAGIGPIKIVKSRQRHYTKRRPKVPTKEEQLMRLVRPKLLKRRTLLERLQDGDVPARLSA